jgi:hypothetical protein
MLRAPAQVESQTLQSIVKLKLDGIEIFSEEPVCRSMRRRDAAQGKPRKKLVESGWVNRDSPAQIAKPAGGAGRL